MQKSCPFGQDFFVQNVKLLTAIVCFACAVCFCNAQRLREVKALLNPMPTVFCEKTTYCR